MNIVLIPYTWTRHVAPGLVTGSVALFAWWGWLIYYTVLAPKLFSMGLLLTLPAQGFMLLCSVSALLAGTSVAMEGALYRHSVLRRAATIVAVAFGTFVASAIAFGVTGGIVGVFMGQEMSAIAADGSLVTLRYRVMQWIMVGLMTGLGPVVARRGAGFLTHAFGGMVSAGIGCATWHYLGFHLFQDYYLASALGFFSWGLFYGLLIWAVPRDLYAGWVRVLSAYRYGYRIPIDSLQGGLSERFVGHFPRGLDLFLPVERGVAELHVSALVDGEQNYAVRGLSVWPTLTRRMLERVDLRYDPRSPAPLQTYLHNGDRMVLSDGVNETHLEFLLLPKEER